MGHRRTPIVRPFHADGVSPLRGRRANTGVPGRSSSVSSKIAVTEADSVSGQTKTKLTPRSRSVTAAALKLVTRKRQRSVRLTRVARRSSVSAEGCANTKREGGDAPDSFRTGVLDRLVFMTTPPSSKKHACAVPGCRQSRQGPMSPWNAVSSVRAESAVSFVPTTLLPRDAVGESWCTASAVRSRAFARPPPSSWRDRGAP